MEGERYDMQDDSSWSLIRDITGLVYSVNVFLHKHMLSFSFSFIQNIENTSLKPNCQWVVVL